MSVVIVGIIRRKPVLTHASIVCEGMLASVNSVNSVKRRKEEEVMARCSPNHVTVSGYRINMSDQESGDGGKGRGCVCFLCCILL